MISSFDIFDTCLVRKCGTPENFFDVLSLRAFNGEVEEWARQEFVVARRKAEQSLFDKPYSTLQTIWEVFDWSHPQLLQVSDLYRIEQELEREMFVPVLKMLDKVESCRRKGHHVVFISDMYLSSTFLKGVLSSFGFYKEGDTLYVSCECGATKRNGELFRYIKEQEGATYRRWEHFGDNCVGDFKIPRSLGIKSTLIDHKYTPYQNQWVKGDCSLGFKFPSVLAGLGRALHHSNKLNTHTDFVLDIIAPFYCSWVCQVLDNAQKQGIQRLYFCARDAYQIYKVALRLQHLYPDVGIEYVYMSRQSLYINRENDVAKIDYFQRIGLATKTDKVAIVDTTTSGKTPRILNEILVEYGFCPVWSYLIFLWHSTGQHNMCNAAVFNDYVLQNKSKNDLWSQLFLVENLFSVNNELKTIDYRGDGYGEPVFSSESTKEDCIIDDNVDWAVEHERLLALYVDSFVELGLCRYANSIFSHIAIPTLYKYLDYPEKDYLELLASYYSYFGENNTKPIYYIKKTPLWKVWLKKERDYYWRRGTIVYNLPNWMNRLFYLIKS